MMWPLAIKKGHSQSHKSTVVLLYFDIMQSVSTFESEVRNLLSTLEPHSMDSLDHQHSAKKLSPKIALHFKVLCKSKATLPIKHLSTTTLSYYVGNHLPKKLLIIMMIINNKAKVGKPTFITNLNCGKCNVTFHG